MRYTNSLPLTIDTLHAISLAKHKPATRQLYGRETETYIMYNTK